MNATRLADLMAYALPYRATLALGALLMLVESLVTLSVPWLGGRLAEGLLGIGYLDPQNPGLIVAELRRLIARAQPTLREVTLLRGMGRQIQWAARRIANGPPGTDNLPSPKDAEHE